MSSYTTATGHDTTIVEIADGNEVRYWCESLGCTKRSCANRFRRSAARREVREFLKLLSARGAY
jgi:hypothetical protein